MDDLSVTSTDLYKALQDASRLYDEYSQLAQLAAFSNTEIDEREAAIWTERSFDHPLGLTITTK